VFLPGANASPDAALLDVDTFAEGDKDLGVVEWVWMNQRPAGHGTDTLPAARALVVPLKGSKGRVGVLALFPNANARLSDPDDRQLLDTFTGLIASALERTQLADEARRARLRAETEHLRNALLSSVSHDLRTPLGVITGATSVLLDESTKPDEATQRDLIQTAHDEADRLSRLVRNLLDMTRLEAGALKIRKTPESVEEIVGSALGRTSDRLRGRKIETEIPSELVAPVDSALVEQVLINLLENAAKYTPDRSPINVAARRRGDSVEIDVADRGPGIPKEDAARVFDKFYRARESEGGGVGLGLTVCRGIVEAHEGHIEVLERSGGGATFRISLPAS
jgi:two-component system sensor histidine kinase KdpD